VDNATPRPSPWPRAEFRHLLPLATRWRDNDAYGHVNNVVYYEWFDTVVNEYLVRAGVLDIAGSPVIGLAVHTRCDFFTDLAFPQAIEAALRVAHIGRSSVRYEIAIFAVGAASASAQGQLVHVYVDRISRRPAPLPAALRVALERIAA
jgi:acyl-CoA thioester hydrolase